MKSEALFKLLFPAVLSIMFFLTTILLLATFGFWVGIPVNPLYVPLSLLLTLILIWRWASPKRLLTISFLFMLLLSYLLSTLFIDQSWDGQVIHQPAIFFLADGWNPFHASQVPTPFENNLWIEHYPKASWIIGATILSLTDSIEAAKIMNYLLLFALILLSIEFVGRMTLMGVRWQLLLALLICLNPVLLVQLNTLYVDGNLYAALMVLTFSLVLYLKFRLKKYLLPAALSFIILVNLKFTGLVYGISLLFIVLIVKARLDRRIDVKSIFLVFAGCVLAVVLVGYAPYASNLLDHGHPFYPLMGKNKVDIISNQVDKDFSRLDRFSKFFYANFSNIEYQKLFPRLKNPLSFELKKLYYYRQPDLRIGGLGLFFGLILSLSVFLLIGVVWIRPLDRGFSWLWLVFLLILISAVINPEMWWARYAPQLWVLPLIPVFLAMQFKNMPIRYLAQGLVAIICINGLLVLAANIYVNGSRTLAQRAIYHDLYKKSFVELAMLPDRKGFSLALKRKLADYRVNYRMIRYIDFKRKYRNYATLLNRTAVYKASASPMMRN